LSRTVFDRKCLEQHDLLAVDAWNKWAFACHTPFPAGNGWNKAHNTLPALRSTAATR